jgi:hypothetical protein
MVKYILSGQEKARAAALAAEVLGIAKPIEYACEHVLVHLKGGPKVMEIAQDGDMLVCRDCSPL